MNKRITVRLDEDVFNFIAKIKSCQAVNLSQLVRTAINNYLINGIDNKWHVSAPEKGLSNEV